MQGEWSMMMTERATATDLIHKNAGFTEGGVKNTVISISGFTNRRATGQSKRFFNQGRSIEG